MSQRIFAGCISTFILPFFFLVNKDYLIFSGCMTIEFKSIEWNLVLTV